MSTIKMIRKDLSEHQFKQVEVYPISDMHVGSKSFDVTGLRKLVEEIASEPYRFAVLAGDLSDNATKSSVSDIYEATIPPGEQPKHVAELLAPIKDKILAVTSGNHCWRTKKDVDLDPMAIIAAKLNLENVYEPDMAFIKLIAGKRNDNKNKPPNYCILVTHGSGGGQGVGAGLNKTEPYALSMGCDLLITGHTHRPSTAPILKYECNMSKGVMVPKEIRLLISTGWLEYSGYPVRKLMKPVAVRPNKAILNTRKYDIAVLS